jgi:hypothetical protein
VPGSYRIDLAKRVNGTMTVIAPEQQFKVVQMRERGLKGAEPGEMVAFTLKLDGMNRQVSGATSAITAFLAETAAIKDTLLRSSAPQALRDDTRELELELLDIQERLSTNEQRGNYGDPGPVSISRRLEVATYGTFRSTYGPTPTHQRSLEIAAEEFSAIHARLQEIGDKRLPELRAALDRAGVPWTPGRSVPARD